MEIETVSTETKVQHKTHRGIKRWIRHEMRASKNRRHYRRLNNPSFWDILTSQKPKHTHHSDVGNWRFRWPGVAFCLDAIKASGRRFRKRYFQTKKHAFVGLTEQTMPEMDLGLKALKEEKEARIAAIKEQRTFKDRVKGLFGRSDLDKLEKEFNELEAARRAEIRREQKAVSMKPTVKNEEIPAKVTEQEQKDISDGKPGAEWEPNDWFHKSLDFLSAPISLKRPAKEEVKKVVPASVENSAEKEQLMAAFRKRAQELSSDSTMELIPDFTKFEDAENIQEVLGTLIDALRVKIKLTDLEMGEINLMSRLVNAYGKGSQKYIHRHINDRFQLAVAYSVAQKLEQAGIVVPQTEKEYCIQNNEKSRQKIHEWRVKLEKDNRNKAAAQVAAQTAPVSEESQTSVVDAAQTAPAAETTALTPAQKKSVLHKTAPWNAAGFVALAGLLSLHGCKSQSPAHLDVAATQAYINRPAQEQFMSEQDVLRAHKDFMARSMVLLNMPMNVVKRAVQETEVAEEPVEEIPAKELEQPGQEAENTPTKEVSSVPEISTQEPQDVGAENEQTPVVEQDQTPVSQVAEPAKAQTVAESEEPAVLIRPYKGMPIGTKIGKNAAETSVVSPEPVTPAPASKVQTVAESDQIKTNSVKKSNSVLEYNGVQIAEDTWIEFGGLGTDRILPRFMKAGDLVQLCDGDLSKLPAVVQAIDANKIVSRAVSTNQPIKLGPLTVGMKRVETDQMRFMNKQTGQEVVIPFESEVHQPSISANLFRFVRTKMPDGRFVYGYQEGTGALSFEKTTATSVRHVNMHRGDHGRSAPRR